MKIWEKVNNITGHSSKARYLVEYVNAGAKFILSSLPEKFLWTVATETEINGFDTSGNSEIGSGSKISYDKILAVYRYDSGKKRVCAEAPDKSIHIFDEGSSLLRATEMFPKFYKLGGKIFIKPDPDYNAHVGSGNAYQHAYTDLDGSTITVESEEGDKGVVVYSAPPVVDENDDSWILVEYENVAILYAASLDCLRLVSSYRDKCETEIKEITTASTGLLALFRSKMPELDLTIDTNSVAVSIPNIDLDLVVSEELPTFSITKDLPTDFSYTTELPSPISLSSSLPSLDVSGISEPSAVNVSTSLPDDMVIGTSLPSVGTLPDMDTDVSAFSITKSIPSFSFGKTFPGELNMTKSLPDDFVLTRAFPTAINVGATFPSDMNITVDFPTFEFNGVPPAPVSTTKDLPSSMDNDMTTDLPSFQLSTIVPGPVKVEASLPSAFSLQSVFPTDLAVGASLPDDFDISSVTFPDGFSLTTQLPAFLADANFTIDHTGVDSALDSAKDLALSGLDTGDSSPNEDERALSALHWLYEEDPDMVNSTFSGVGAELQRAQAEISKQTQLIDNHRNKISTESQRFQSMVQLYQTEAQNEQTRVRTDTDRYKAKIDAEGSRINAQLSKYTGDFNKEAKRIDSQLQKYQLESQAEQTRINAESEAYRLELDKEKTRINTELTRLKEDVNKETVRMQSELTKYQTEFQFLTNKSEQDIKIYVAELDGEKTRIEAETTKYTKELDAAVNVHKTKAENYSLEVQKETARIDNGIKRYQIEMETEVSRYREELNAYRAEFEK